MRQVEVARDAGPRGKIVTLILTDIEAVHGVKAYDRKEEVIINYEVPLLRRFRDANLTVEVLFRSSTGGDETTARWRELIQRGFPFVKARALLLPGAEDWRNVLEAQGYDARIAERTLAIIERHDVRPAQSPLPQA